ncbi:hypothetical protein D3C80_1058290 [compost metagenome]
MRARIVHGVLARRDETVAHRRRHEGVVDRDQGAPRIEHGADAVLGGDVGEDHFAEDLQVVVQAIVGLGVDIGPLQRRDQGVRVLIAPLVLRIGAVDHAASAGVERTEGLGRGVEDHIGPGAAGAERQIARRRPQGEIGVAQVPHGDARRNSVVRSRIGRIGHEAVAGPQAPVAARQTPAFGTADVQDGVAAIIVDACGQAIGQGVVVAALVRSILHLRLDAVEVVLEDQVDDPGHGVGAIDGRSAARLHLDPLDQRGWNVAQVEGQEVGIVGRARTPATVHHGQGAADAQVAQVDLVQPDIAEAVAGVGVGQARRDLRHLIQNIDDVGDALGLDGLGRDRHGRRRRVQPAALQARAGDHDLIDLRRLSVRRRLRLGLNRQRRSQSAQAYPRSQNAFAQSSVRELSSRHPPHDYPSLRL